MLRTTTLGLLLITATAAAVTTGCVSPAAAASPVRYEVQINGENFVVEGNQLTTLRSKEKPGVSYHVAVRVAPDPAGPARRSAIRLRAAGQAGVPRQAAASLRAADARIGFFDLANRPRPTTWNRRTASRR